MSGRPGPAPPRATPTRDARHLPAHLPALSSQPGGPGLFLDGHCSSFFCGNTEWRARWGNLSGCHQPSTGTLASLDTAPAANRYREMQARQAGNFVNALTALWRVCREAVATHCCART